MKVGYYFGSYLEQRNIINIVPDATYVKVHDLYRVMRWGSRKINKIFHANQLIDTKDLLFLFDDLGLNKVDIIHLFHAISFSKTPWVTTFSTIVPRFQTTLSCHHGQDCGYAALIKDTRLLKALEALSGDSCKKIIALSECNFTMQKEFIHRFPDFQKEIERKITYLHPPQKRLIDKYEDKKLTENDEVNFMFVGKGFIRKGGSEILKVFEEARRKRGYHIKLTIVSSLVVDSYATKETEKDIETVRNIIQNNSDWIDYFRYLPNDQVVELMKSAHIGLLPTYADTYGYSVLEFQAAGCPVISTNVRALPEINNNNMGWIIEVPKNRLGEALYTTKEEREKISCAIIQGLKNAIEELMENRDLIQKKGQEALQHIRKNHSIETAAERLREIYLDALR